MLGMWFAVPFMMFSLWGAYLTSCIGHSYIERLLVLSSDDSLDVV